MKYGNAINKIAEEWVSEHGLIEYGGGQLQDFNAHLGINDKTYRRWLDEQPDFKAAIERGRTTFKKSLAHQLHETLSDAAKGGYREDEDEQTEYRPDAKNPDKPRIVKMIKTKHRKFFKPDIGAAIFLITNLDPEHYQNRQKNDIILKNTEEKEMTIEEINKEIERLSKIETKE